MFLLLNPPSSKVLLSHHHGWKYREDGNWEERLILPSMQGVGAIYLNIPPIFRKASIAQCEAFRYCLNK